MTDQTIDTPTAAITIDELCEIAAQRGELHKAVARFLMKRRPGARAQFYIDLAGLRKRGLMITDATLLMHANATDDNTRLLGRIGPLACMLADWCQRKVEFGEADGEIAADWLPGLEAQLLGTYADTGLPPEPLRLLAYETKETAAWFRKVRRSLTMPAIVFGGAVGSIMWVSLVKFPQMLKRSNGRLHLDGSGAFAQQMSEYFVAYWWLLAIVAGGAIGLFMYSLGHWSKRLGLVRQVLDDWLPYSFYRDFTSLAFLDQIGSLMIARKSESEALDTLMETSNPYVQGHIEAVLEYPQLSMIEALHRANRNWPRRALVRTLRTSATGENPGQAIKDAVADEKALLRDRLEVLQSWIEIFVPFLGFGLVLWIYSLTSSLTNTLGISH